MSTPQPLLSHPKYRPDIDGLRAVAVLSVVAFHAFPSWMQGGFIGVDVFFVISGYLITTIIFENLDRDTFRFSEFYSRRIRRIFPALILVLITCYTFGWFTLLSDEYKQLGKYMAAGAGFVSNFTLLNDIGYFDNLAETKPLLHLWSLGIEEQFYIIWPLLLWLAWKRKFNLLALTTLAVVISFFLNVKLIKQDAASTFFSPQTRFWELLSGSLLSWAMLYKKSVLEDLILKTDNLLLTITYRTKKQSDGYLLSNIISWIGFILLIYGFLKINKNFIFPGSWALIPVLSAVLIISAGPNAWVNQRILSHKLAVWVGLISFPLYLWHWPILSFARIIEGETPGKFIRISAVLLSVALSWFTYYFIERHIRHEVSRRTTLWLLLLMTLVGTLGLYTFIRNGFEFRSIAKVGMGISDAKSDWHYESTKLIKGNIVNIHYLHGQQTDSVLFIGSSHMGQYFPRVSLLYNSSKPKLTTIYASRNHCTPIPYFNFVSAPENINCEEYYQAALKMAYKKEVVKIVFGANWPNFYENEKLTLQAEKFSQDLRALMNNGKEIYIISNPPISHRLDPNFLAKSLRLNINKSLSDSFIERSILENKNTLHQIIRFSKKTKVHVINPYDYLCRDNLCPTVRSGMLLYNDQGHIRAKYAESNATFIDKLLNE